MLTRVLLASAIAFAAPAVAQEMTPAPDAAATPQQTAPAAQPAPTAPAADPAGTSAPSAATPADTTAAQPAASTDVASVVQAEFPSYDGNKDGELTKAEFSKWMVALKTKSGDKTPEAELNKWAGKAFAQADTDKSKSVSQSELTTFLQG